MPRQESLVKPKPKNIKKGFVMNNTTDFFEEVNISTFKNAFDWISNQTIQSITEEKEKELTEEQKKSSLSK